MENTESQDAPKEISRRGFLGRVTIGLAAAAAISLPFGASATGGSDPDGSTDALPEDSIFRPRDGAVDNDKRSLT